MDTAEKIINVPVKMADQFYFVGNYDTSAHLIVTGEGLILLDTGFPECVDNILHSLDVLGYAPADIRMIVLSHGHADHFGGVNRLKTMTDAPVWIGQEDADACRGLNQTSKVANRRSDLFFEPDRTFADGDILSFGGCDILCVHTPGHTEGTYSFFFDVTFGGKTYRAGTFGGAGVNTVNAKYFLRTGTPYFARREYFDSLERLKREKVDLFFGNHAWNNRTYEKALAVEEGQADAFLVPDEWQAFLEKKERGLWKKIRSDAQETFCNFAHRGASEVCPENTLLSFAVGVYMGANGVETDVRQTADGVLVLHHDKTALRTCGEDRPIAEMTFDELSALRVVSGAHSDKIPTLEAFLEFMAYRDLRFAIEVKAPGITEQLLALLSRYDLKPKCTITSFQLPYLLEIRAQDPSWRLGYLAKDLAGETLSLLAENGIDEICPRACMLDEAELHRLQRLGFRVRAWGVGNRDEMRRLYDLGVDGMTVNFPDALVAYHAEHTPQA